MGVESLRRYSGEPRTARITGRVGLGGVGGGAREVNGGLFSQ